MLFIILTEFLHENYNGVIRQLMKCFLRSIQWLLQSILRLRDTQSVGYLLVIFETFIAKAKVKKDYFDLCKMRNILITDQEAKEMDLNNSLGSTTLCELQRISSPEVKSKHVIVCITGFMQEDEDKAEYWEHLVKHYRHAEIFAVSWNACTPWIMLSGGSFQK